MAHTDVNEFVVFIAADTLLTLMTLDVPCWRECAPLIRRDWKARTTKNGAIVLSAKISAQFCTVSGSKGSFAAFLFAMKSGVTKGTAKPGTTGTSAWTRGTEDDTIDELIDENIELAVDSFNVLDPDLDAVFICDVHLNPVGTSAAGTNIMGREHLLTRRGILGHL